MNTTSLPVADAPGIRPTPAQRSFRADVRALLRSPRVQDEVDRIRRLPPGDEPGLLETYRLLGERGWLAPSWPEQYGGLGLGHHESAVVTEEMILASVPDDAHVLSVDIVGRFVLDSGTDAQRTRLLPALARGEQIATVLFTEPQAGSDLGRMTTRAEPDGDGAWRLYGTKVFNQKSGFADTALCAAVTVPGPMPGIGLFLLPLRSPGVTIRTLSNLTDDAFCEISIDGVRLTRDDVLGEVDDGWRLISELLVLERTGVDFHAKIRHWLDSVADAVPDALRERYTELDARLTAGHALAWRMVAGLDAGHADPVLAAMSKWYVTEQAREVARFGLELRGREGLLTNQDPDAPDLGRVERALRYAPTLTLASGTSEVMLRAIATSHLELL
ncbi:Acryloyl-CoA reductase (NADH) [Streptomyces sp. YIM 130001]|uniref:acyl-CoA dehydrogenase family protein n=1 Tax=Streptomyces sp. YIM 130001 TaxID=2259644 RepID=UPI000EC3B650|nr:acyl-CoA dehydrogenase family protein [Streptomyces sp. YIM 130001]RII13400.1 Acryloyl-CoA reductase (NADH) [Streptomyces sp. YIM 130001]